MYDVIAQGVGIVAMAFNIFSYQQKKAKHIIAFQLFGGLFFGISYFMLGAYIGAVLNVVGVARALLFLKKDKFHTDGQYPVAYFLLQPVCCFLCAEFYRFRAGACP